MASQIKEMMDYLDDNEVDEMDRDLEGPREYKELKKELEKWKLENDKLIPKEE